MTEKTNQNNANRTSGSRALRLLKAVYGFLSSAKLAIALLLVIFACCIVGVTVLSSKGGSLAWRLIFTTAWFNGLLVMLVLNVAFCFFGRIWRRKLTLITFGMIVFHLSFVSIFAGVIYNSLYSFYGNIRLTEGEVLPSSDPRSYDVIRQGRFFDFSKLKGFTTLVKMHRGYMVEGEDKVVAYEVSVGEPGSETSGILYITNNLTHKGFRYIRDREGYSLLIILYDAITGMELYGVHVPLQSLMQDDGSFLYTTGTWEGPGSFPFPSGPEMPLFLLQAVYHPSRFSERGGDVTFKIRQPHGKSHDNDEPPLAEGKAPVGEMFSLGGYAVSAREVRYWVGMDVRYDPGYPVILTSLWTGFGGIVLVFIGRLRLRRRRTSPAGAQA